VVTEQGWRRIQCGAYRVCGSAIVLPAEVDWRSVLRANGWHLERGDVWVCGRSHIHIEITIDQPRDVSCPPHFRGGRPGMSDRWQ
jgi:hypothetical protein